MERRGERSLILIGLKMNLLLSLFICVYFVGKICGHKSEVLSEKVSAFHFNAGMNTQQTKQHKEISCKISIPQFASRYCLNRRCQSLEENRKIYRLTKPKHPLPVPTTSTLTETNLGQFLAFPVLDLPQNTVIQLTVNNSNAKGWARLYIEMANNNRKLVNISLKDERFKTLHNFSNYAELQDFYRKSQQIQGGHRNLKYFRFPSQEEDFKDIINSNVWQEDKVFVEQRLAGLNPMSLRKLRIAEYNKKFLKFTGALNMQLQRLTKTSSSLEKVIREGFVYVVDYPLLHGLANVPDLLDLNPADSRKMRLSRNPTGIFVSLNVCSNKHQTKYELKPLAIQIDSKPSTRMVFPTDGSKWLLAKQELQRADVTHAEMIEHLLKTHLIMEEVCVTIQRTLSKLHPLYELLQWICRGTIMTNSLGLPRLLNPKEFMHSLFAIGHIGAIELLNKGYAHSAWQDTDFLGNLKRRGVDNRTTLPYFPYRDDGKLIWRRIKSFAKEYIFKYYRCWQEVRDDKELQNFANELSADGVGCNGGMGMLKGFPREILSQEQLSNILARIIFLPLQHHAVNYPVTYYAGFVPNMPTKLYVDPRVPPQEFAIFNLPQSHVATIQVALSMSLGSLRYDKLFDYGPRMKDEKAKDLVARYYKKFKEEVEQILKRRNKNRLKQGHLTYPYFMPEWLPNSIHS